jgi:hypothetical protein
MEYSRRGAYGLGTSNPSQDSAFGSMTDGECSSRASSFKLSSFQSISSPIDEGVEDDLAESRSQSDSNQTSPSHLTVSPTPSTSSRSLYAAAGPSKESPRFLEPPRLFVNDTSTNPSLFYSTSPIRKCATTEVFSQKYRVSSFEDMATSSATPSQTTATSSSSNNRKACRSFDDGHSLDRVAQKASEYNQLRNFSARERQSMWRNNLIRSNECVYETSFGGHQTLPDTSVDRFILTPEPVITTKTKRSSRHMFSLAKFKHSTILDSIALEDFPEEEKNDQTTVTTASPTAPSSADNKNNADSQSSSNTSDDVSENSSITDTLLISPTSSLIYEKPGCVEEITPLLDYDRETVSPVE